MSYQKDPKIAGAEGRRAAIDNRFSTGLRLPIK